MTKYKGYDTGEALLKVIMMGLFILAVAMSVFCYANGLFVYALINIFNAVMAIVYLVELSTA